MIKYPMLTIDLKKLHNNTNVIVDLADKYNIGVAGVIKGFNAIPEIVDEMVKGGCQQIASSRLHHLSETKKRHKSIPTLLLRLPMLSEIEYVINHCDMSLNSEKETLFALDREAKKQHTTHGVILMVDLGDLREGVMTYEEVLALSLLVENKLEHLELLGIGTNLGCYGTVQPTIKNLTKLSAMAEQIETEIGRELEFVSGGSTTSLPLLVKGDIPAKVNHLRIGDGIINPSDLIVDWKLTIEGLEKDTFTLKAQVIEKNTKPTYPIGEMFLDAFGNEGHYIDRGLRKRAILGVGNQDVGDCLQLIPKDDRTEVIGGSSDHTIVDIEDAIIDYRIGDIMKFNLLYQGVLFLTGSPYVNKVVVGD